MRRLLTISLFVPGIAVLFCISVVACAMLTSPVGRVPIGGYVFLGTILGAAVGQWTGRLPRGAWLGAAAWFWILVIAPTFGVVTLLIAARLHWLLPPPFAIFTGITLTMVYKAAVPSFELPHVDHPFPPLGPAELFAISLSTLGVAVAAAFYLWRRGAGHGGRAALREGPGPA